MPSAAGDTFVKRPTKARTNAIILCQFSDETSSEESSRIPTSIAPGAEKNVPLITDSWYVENLTILSCGNSNHPSALKLSLLLKPQHQPKKHNTNTVKNISKKKTPRNYKNTTNPTQPNPTQPNPCDQIQIQTKRPKKIQTTEYYPYTILGMNHVY